jgi:hypothetical protein
LPTTSSAASCSGARSEARLVELWLSGKAPSTRRKYEEDLKALIRDTLRHSDIGTTSRYLHARPNDSSGLHLGL